MNKIDRLKDKCSDINPLEGRVLIMPLRKRTFKGLGFTQEPVLDDKGEPSLTDEGIPEMAMVEVEQVKPYMYQRGVVLQKPADETRFDIGDTIIYTEGSISNFDLIKGVSLVRRFDIIASV